MNTNKVRTKLTITMVTIVTMISMVLMVYPASAEATRVEFQNYNIACSINSQNLWVSDGGIVHIRDREMDSVVISTSEYHNGTGVIVGNANIFDPAAGFGVHYGTLDIYPTAHSDGYWYGNWSMQITENGFHGIAHLKGYGSLEGMLSFSSLTPLPPEILATFAPYCGGNQPVAGTYGEGYYLIPGGE